MISALKSVAYYKQEAGVSPKWRKSTASLDDPATRRDALRNNDAEFLGNIRKINTFREIILIEAHDGNGTKSERGANVGVVEARELSEVFEEFLGARVVPRRVLVPLSVWRRDN